MELEGSLPHSQEPATYCLVCTERSVWFRGFCRPSTAAYVIYSQLPSITAGRSSTRNLRTRHAVVTGTHLWQLE
jgi:hypothetical protein